MPPRALPADFEPSGLLPAGTFVATIALLRTSLLVEGPVVALPSWDRPWRLHLVDQLEALVQDLWSVGIDRVFADGSFCTEKPRPGDIDGHFITSFPEWPARHEQLKRRRPVWTWSPRDLRPAADGKPKLPLWHQHRIELFPVFDPPFRAHSFRGTQTTQGPVFIDEFFRRTRDGRPKGIVQIVKEPTS
jgi:hypothetical protein